MRHSTAGPIMQQLLKLAVGSAIISQLAGAVVSAQTLDQLIPHKVKIESVEYRGKRAVGVTEDGVVPKAEAYAIVKDAAFHNGTIELELAGQPTAAAAATAARGFIGIGFRLQNDRYEYISLRPTNGRAD